MEMVEPSKAGVAFSANPLNSDLDEMVVDSSWGLGESVVDGSIMADRFIWDKLGSVVLETKIGNKERERRVCASGGGVEELQVSEERAGQTTLSEDELLSLAKLVSSVEAAYGKPVDVEWAYTQQGELKLLQARPITTIFPLDPAMLTKPGEPRRLYFDFHIASDATTIHPFTHMDLDAYWEVWTKATGFGDISHPPDDSGDHLFFNGATRQYINVSATSRLGYSPSTMTKEYEQIDLYAASILKGKEATNPKYKADKLPDDVTFANAWWLFRRMPLWHMYIMKNKFKANPVQCGSELRLLLTTARADMKAIVAKGPTSQGGLIEYVNALARAAFPALDLQCAGAFLTLSVFKELGRQNKAGETQQIRDEAAAMMLGYKGDPLMEMNIAMYHLAQSLPVELWAEYDDKLDDLSDRIQRNVESRASTGDKLPAAFITSWKAFMSDFGYDGTDQLFVSSPRYHEQPVLLLQKIRHSAGTDVKDPEQAMLQARDRRQAAQKAQLDAAKANAKWYKSTVQAVLKRNEALDEVMWIRNSPKLFQSEILSAVRTGVLVCETQLLEANRLDEAGDVFHLKLSEVDRGLCCPELDLRYLIAPRKAQYLRTKRAGMTPFLVDSRCRILKPDVKEQQPGTLVGMAIAPGVATGRLRILKSPSEKIGRGDILATVVTDPAWTPLFIGCAAVVLQVGGALQHGALCAREYGKPGVSCIDMADLTDGMMVSVDGNTGVVTILAEE
ncbi:hypothetical protein, variant [Sphaeroforma arctica JP610]|nr:hypothetical protein, variant [Sphaeroforma arctica JP610]KNC79273.1 hypothetical protein, variant [Sphaeroforma arctica JP610]|eukprot:XP_014153175.1 hypothetical protein, variant [Sphaeroforma arctica JP610]